MKICFFADSGSIHTARWCQHFHNLGHEIHVITYNQAEIPNSKTYFLNVGEISTKGGNWKLLFKYREVKKTLKEINPDVFHAMYANSYGVTGSLCRFKPYVITALGSYLLISPQSSIIYRILLRFAFSRAQLITVMSDQMKRRRRN